MVKETNNFSSIIELPKDSKKDLKIETSFITFKTFLDVTNYLTSIHQMESHVLKMMKGEAGPEVWFLTYPPLYTLGTSAQAAHVLNHTVPCYETGRGGQVTYHGPGQRVVYVMLDLTAYGQDLHQYITLLEEWLILSLKDLGLQGVRRKGRVGVWICEPHQIEKKIAAIGIRVKKWIAFHGISFNIDPDLSYYQGIVPCGLSSYGVTSLKDQNISISTEQVDLLLKKNFEKVFKIGSS